MKAIRNAYLTGCCLCLPILIYLVGALYTAEPTADHALTILANLKTLLLVLLISLLLFSSWFCSEFSRIDCLLANFALALTPLPLFALAWLAAAMSTVAAVKIMLFLFGVSGLAAVLHWPRKIRQIPPSLTMLFWIIISVGVWASQDIWLSYLL